MKAVILAGGKGTRMGDIAANIPKPMLKIGNKPLLEHQIDLLRNHGITDIIICVHHLSNIIKDYFGNGSKFGVNISYSEEETPLGTAGAVKAIEQELTETTLIFYGDVMVNMDLNRLLKFHDKNKADITLVTHPNDHPFDSDLIEADRKNRILALHQKPHPKDRYFHNLVSAALYVINKDILKNIPSNIKFDFAHEIFPRLIEEGYKLYSYNTPEYLKDVGTPERINEVDKDYKTGKIELCNLSKKRKAIFLDRDGVINEEVDSLHNIDQFKLLPNVEEAIKMVNRSDYLCIIVTNQPVVAKGFCTIEDIYKIHAKMETLLGLKGAKLDAIYFCPHHPEKGFPGENPKYKIKCKCRKPDIGLIKQASKDFNIDLKHSFIIGDSTRDAMTAKNAGIKSIIVETGYGGKDNKFDAKPDYTCKDLYGAVNIIFKNTS